MKINFVNADHAHARGIDLPTGITIEQNRSKLFKGASSHSINEQNLVIGRFAWGPATVRFLCRNLT